MTLGPYEAEVKLFPDNESSCARRRCLTTSRAPSHGNPCRRRVNRASLHQMIEDATARIMGRHWDTGVQGRLVDVCKYEPAAEVRGYSTMKWDISWEC